MKLFETNEVCPTAGASRGLDFGGQKEGRMSGSWHTVFLMGARFKYTIHWQVLLSAVGRKRPLV